MSERDELEQLANAGDQEAIEKLQALNGCLGLRDGDADYLEAYLKLCDRFISGGMRRRDAESELNELNKKYRTKVGPQTLRSYVMGDNLAPDSDSWVPSEICY